jgi:TonB-linked SusC/RagA family outer membrane protein
LERVRRFALGALACAILAFPTLVQAQEAMVITGTVTDETGAPLVAANIYISDTNLATFSGADGRYQLVIPAAAVTGEVRELVGGLIGYRSMRYQVTLSGDDLSQDFSLALDPIGLEGIVAIGQGLTSERRKLANAISTVDGDAIRERYTNNAIAALSAQAPSVYVQQSGGEPAAGAFIQIRGQKSVEGGTQPLIVVDGTIINNDSDQTEAAIWGTVVQNRAMDINPDDIESMEILKGPSAAAIYGANGANGAILITTKSGTAGQTQVTLKTNYSDDRATNTVDLQRTHSTTNSPSSIRSWGAELPSGTQTFDHANEMFVTGHRWDTDLTVSGGTERTTYFFSGGYTSHTAAVVGPGGLNTTNFRLKGSHLFFNTLTIGGNIAYTGQAGHTVQQGSNLSGLLLGAFRTPPNINNLPYLTENGNQRTWFCVLNETCDIPNTLRLFDNPFWVANEIPNTTDVGRVFGNLRIDWDALSWLTVTNIFGGDYANDSRLSLFPKQNSELPTGFMLRADFIEKSYDNTLFFTGTADSGENFATSLTLGFNIRQEDVDNLQVDAQNLTGGAGQLDFTVDQTPDEFTAQTRTSGFFATASFDLYNQLFLSGGARYEGSSTFGGGEGSWFLFPSGSLAWEFTRALGIESDAALNFGKLRVAYGEAGTPPPIFSNVSGFEKNSFEDGWIELGLESFYLGREGLVSEPSQGNQDIKPEITSELEAGLDLAFLNSRISAGITWFQQKTRDAILFLPIPESTGFNTFPSNGAKFESQGWEFTLGLIPFQGQNFTWEITGFYSDYATKITDLLGTNQIALGGFTSLQPSVVLDNCGPAQDEQCAYGVLWGRDWMRFGRGVMADYDNDGTLNDIDAEFPGAAAGTLFVGPDGFPIQDPVSRVNGDPNPDWLGSVRTTFTILQNLQVMALFDFTNGPDMWNGTQGALFSYGTSAHLEERICAGGRGTCGATEGQAWTFDGQGPGAGQLVYLNTDTAGPSSVFNGFNGPSARYGPDDCASCGFIQDASFTKFRNFQVTYDFTQNWVRSISLNRISVFIAGNNLMTSTNYLGLDPESNLNGQNAARGMEYFNNPQIRSYVFGISFIY